LSRLLPPPPLPYGPCPTGPLASHRSSAHPHPCRKTHIYEARRCVPTIVEAGWVIAPEPADATQRRLSLCYPTVEHRSHHLHVVEERFDEWRGWLAFRDRLRADAAVAAAYAALKKGLAERHGGDPNAREPYRTGKAQFIAEVTAAALQTDPLDGSN
jgi:GrpB-like predicted nucleotidyltransferase (UPF0157 family)